ncbi:hypothetical protein GOARA_043_00570 [Gordonia araii NBRC 100433]|uniref:DUF1275 family protein n=1 Tax=Gordonia araii NBRC 100433 TaxID=1073574 RepID=G7H121_9ACTN|nr:YoaK family protein [Gordonia araii]NNG96732.1 DUF1275 domain-containing protein [Gordonia araii NBRC 100433]GAB09582.1 hypothetical protein GOARA_043_00570 [Gordonia araii NBRC 100433]
MPSIRPREWLLAGVLSSTAGYLDAVGFLNLGGYFVSFMSGNTTRMSAEATNADLVGAGKALGLIGLFFVGSFFGAVVSRYRDGRVSVLAATSVLVAAAVAASYLSWFPVPSILIVVVAMGTMNATFLRDGEVAVGLTYMTGAVVKAGQRLADAVFGGPRWMWLRPLVLWASLALGALLGGWAYSAMGLAALWPVLILLVGTTVATWSVRRADAKPSPARG